MRLGRPARSSTTSCPNSIDVMATFNIINGDALDVLASIESNLLHVCVTSPPYYGLRDYGSPPRIWGGQPQCDHVWGVTIPQDKRHQYTAANSGEKQTASEEYPKVRGAYCTKCNAWRGAFGLEPTPELYVEHAVAIFREVRRVLRNDGTLWCNLGDSYAGGGHGGGGNGRAGFDPEIDKNQQASWRAGNRTPVGLKAKDLIGIPWMMAFALRADGWYLRSDNLWSKLNAMPESVKGTRWEKCKIKVASHRTQDQGYVAAGEHRGNVHGNLEDQPSADYLPCLGCDKCSANDGYVLRKGSWRPTRAHEYMFQFTKTADYYSDGEAVMEEAVGGQSAKSASFKRSGSKRGVAHVGQSVGTHREERAAVAYNGETRNKRSVWSLASQPFKEAHFAVFPPALVEPCILSSTSEYGCCSVCKAPYARMLITERNGATLASPDKLDRIATEGALSGGAKAKQLGPNVQRTTTAGWRKTCDCPGDAIVPATAFDPFSGAGTTGLVALSLKRNYLGIDVNSDYCEMARRRLANTQHSGQTLQTFVLPELV